MAEIIRLRLIAICRERRCDLIKGSPSDCLFSSLTSRLVIIVRFRFRRTTTNTSTAASSSPAAIAARSSVPTPSPAAASTAVSGSEPLVMRTGTSPCTANQSTSPTTVVFSSALTPFHSACTPNTRLIPCTGSKWSGCGAIRRKCTPPWATAAASTATAVTPSIGPMMVPTDAMASANTGSSCRSWGPR